MVKTLLVDDSDVFRHSLRQVLSARYPFIRVAETGSYGEALRLCRRLRPDLVFAEVRLHDGNGLALPRAISEWLPHAHVCMVTASDLPEYREAARLAGARHFLAKDESTLAEIGAVVDDALTGRAPALVIDSDTVRRESVARALHLRWPELLVLEAADAEGALPMIAYAKPVVVLLRDSGAAAAARALLEAARKANGGAVVALLSAAEEATRLKGAHGSAADYVGPLGRNAARLETLVAGALRAQRVSR